MLYGSYVHNAIKELCALSLFMKYSVCHVEITYSLIVNIDIVNLFPIVEEVLVICIGDIVSSYAFSYRLFD